MNYVSDLIDSRICGFTHRVVPGTGHEVIELPAPMTVLDVLVGSNDAYVGVL